MIEIKELQDKVNFYKKQITEMEAYISCLKAELLEVQDHSSKLKKELEMKDGTKMFEALMKNTSGEAREMLARHMYDNLRCEVNLEFQQKEAVFPSEPIKVAGELIYATESCKDLLGREYHTNLYKVDDLRQIAEHLLVYCNNQKG